MFNAADGERTTGGERARAKIRRNSFAQSEFERRAARTCET
jgi:hypothetical protein